MKRAVITALGLAGASLSFGWMQWSGNGHYYEIFEIDGSDFSWSAANAQASSLAGGTAYLATITSSDENDFVFALADDAAYWKVDVAGNNEGPYLGGFQPVGSSEPSGGWQWVTGETWSYTNWWPGEPNNFGGDESRLVLFSGGSARSNRWNDVGDNADSIIHWYVAEVEAVPEPATLAVLATGALALLRRKRKV